MKHSAKAAARLFGSVVSAAGIVMTAHGAVDNNPYRAIIERNVFDLKPPPPPVAPPTVTNTPPPNVKLTGITSILGTKRALFMVGAAAQPGKPPGKEESYILEEGQRQGVIEVLEINQKAATVKIKNDGNESVIALDTSAKLPSGPGGPPALPGLPGAPHMPTLAAPSNAAYNRQPTGGAGVPVPNFSQYSQSGANNGNGLSTLPTRALRTGNGVDPLQLLGQQPQQAQQAQSDPLQQTANLSPEEKYVMMEVERQRTKSLTEAGLLPEMPPTPLSPMLQQNNEGNNNNGTTGRR
jgi:hypothetical protein